MASPDQGKFRIITEADLPEVALKASNYFGGLNLRKMLEIAHEASVIEAEYRVVNSGESEPNNPVTQSPDNLSPEVTHG